MDQLPTKYYETLITVRVLSDEPIGEPGGPETLALLMGECVDGHCVGELVSHASRQVGEMHMAELLTAAGSEPGFFEISDAQELASELYDSSSIEGCSPDLIVVERRAFNNLMYVTGLDAYVVPEPEDQGNVPPSQ